MISESREAEQNVQSVYFAMPLEEEGLSENNQAKKGHREGTGNLITDCYLVRIMGTLLDCLRPMGKTKPDRQTHEKGRDR